MAEVHEDDRKLFCGALPQEAKDTDIKEYFSTFGEIDSVNLKMDPVTGRSRYSEYRPPPQVAKTPCVCSYQKSVQCASVKSRV